MTEVALALVLLVGAGLLTRGFLRLQAVDPGFRVEHAVVSRVELPASEYDDDASRHLFREEALSRIGALPGVRFGATVSTLPLSGSANAWSFLVEGSPRPSGAMPLVNAQIVSSGYFDAMGIPLVKGRRFRDDDGPGAVPVAIVNEELARRYWPGEDAVGKRVKLGIEEEEPWTTVVAVAANTRHRGLDRPAEPEVYVPQTRIPLRSMWIVARASVDPMSLAGPMREAIREIDRDLPLTDMTALSGVVERSTWTRELYSLLLGTFGAVALFLAAVGVYGVISYCVAQRRREMGIRMALGSTTLGVGLLVVRRALRPALVGIAMGLVAARLLSPLPSTLLFEVGAGDPPTYVFAAAVLGSVAILASWVPARRAMRADPARSLRAE